MGRFQFRFGALLALSSCIIYRVDPEPSPEPDPRDPVDVPAPEPRPLPTDLSLIIDQATVGETVRSTLVTDEPRGLDGLQAVRFERDVTVVDAVFDLQQAELVIEVAATAEPGAVDLVAQFRQGATVRLDDEFTILPVTTGVTGVTGDTGTPTATGDTAATATGDTSAP